MIVTIIRVTEHQQYSIFTIYNDIWESKYLYFKYLFQFVVFALIHNNVNFNLINKNVLKVDKWNFIDNNIWKCGYFKSEKFSIQTWRCWILHDDSDLEVLDPTWRLRPGRVGSCMTTQTWRYWILHADSDRDVLDPADVSDLDLLDPAWQLRPWGVGSCMTTQTWMCWILLYYSDLEVLDPAWRLRPGCVGSCMTTQTCRCWITHPRITKKSS